MNPRILAISMVILALVGCTKTISTSNNIAVNLESSNAEYTVSYYIFSPNNIQVEARTIESTNGSASIEFQLKENFTATIQAQLTDEAVDRPEQSIHVEVLYNGAPADEQTFSINTKTPSDFYRYSVFN